MKRSAGAGRWAALVLAVLGIACLAVGIGLRTVWAPPTSYQASIEIPANTPVVVTAPGVLEMMPGPVQVTAAGAGSQQLLIARGREADVQAWVGGNEVATITGLSAPHQLALATTRGEQTLPDPATSELWVDQVTSAGNAEYSYRETTGRYVLLFGAVGGPGAPATITFTWPQTEGMPWALPAIVAGAIMLFSAVVLLIRRFTAGRRAAADEVSGTLRPKVSLVKASAAAETQTIPVADEQGTPGETTQTMPTAGSPATPADSEGAR